MNPSEQPLGYVLTRADNTARILQRVDEIIRNNTESSFRANKARRGFWFGSAFDKIPVTDRGIKSGILVE